MKLGRDRRSVGTPMIRNPEIRVLPFTMRLAVPQVFQIILFFFLDSFSVSKFRQKIANSCGEQLFNSRTPMPYLALSTATGIKVKKKFGVKVSILLLFLAFLDHVNFENKPSKIYSLRWNMDSLNYKDETCKWETFNLIWILKERKNYYWNKWLKWKWNFKGINYGRIKQLFS